MEQQPRACPVTGNPFARVYRVPGCGVLCRDVIARFSRDSRRSPGRVGLSPVVDRAAKRSTDLVISAATPLPGWSDLDVTLAGAFGRTFDQYALDVPTFGAWYRAEDRTDTGYQVQHYRADPAKPTWEDGGEGFGWHVDSNDWRSRRRMLAAILYLNDVAEGGRTSFRAWPISVEPRAGRVLLFPTGFEWEHRGEPPLSADKLIVTTFVVPVGSSS